MVVHGIGGTVIKAVETVKTDAQALLAPLDKFRPKSCSHAVLALCAVLLDQLPGWVEELKVIETNKTALDAFQQRLNEQEALLNTMIVKINQRGDVLDVREKEVSDRERALDNVRNELSLARTRNKTLDEQAKSLAADKLRLAQELGVLKAKVAEAKKIIPGLFSDVPN